MSGMSNFLLFILVYVLLSIGESDVTNCKDASGSKVKNGSKKKKKKNLMEALETNLFERSKSLYTKTVAIIAHEVYVAERLLFPHAKSEMSKYTEEIYSETVDGIVHTLGELLIPMRVNLMFISDYLNGLESNNESILNDEVFYDIRLLRSVMYRQRWRNLARRLK